MVETSVDTSPAVKKAGSRRRKKALREKGSKKAVKNRTSSKPAKDDGPNGTLKKLAADIRSAEKRILAAQRTSLDEAVRIGHWLLAAQADLKGLKPRMGFKAWVVQRCGMGYKRAYNYKVLAKAVEENPSLKKMGLTDAFVELGLVKRSSDANDDSTPESKQNPVAPVVPVAPDVAPPVPASEEPDPANEEPDPAAASTPQDASEPPSPASSAPEKPATAAPRVGALQVVVERERRVIELSSNWQEELLEALTDRIAFGELLAAGGIWIRLKR